MTAEAGSDNVHTTNVGSGKNIRGNSPSAGDAGGRNTVARSARRVHGSSTDIGVLLLRNNSTPLPLQMFNGVGRERVS